MTTEQAKALEELEQYVRNVLDLFPWPDDSPMSEEGMQRKIGPMRTTDQVSPEQRRRRFRGALGNLLGEISSYRESEPR